MAPSPISMLQDMMLIRAFEGALAARRDHGFQLLSTGEEAVAVGVCSALQPEDQLLTGGRSIGPALARGLDAGQVLAELLGKSTGTNRGKGGRGHISQPTAGFFGAHAVVGGNLSIAAGVALARQLSGEAGIVVVMFGDGASGAGALHETLNIAALWRLPILFVCNNNQLSVSTPRQAALAPQNISDLALAYGIEAQTIDGMDLDKVAQVSVAYAQDIRQGRGPRFVECLSHRFASHSTTARETRSARDLEDIRLRCPIVSYTARLLDHGDLDRSLLNELELAVARDVSAAIAFADASRFPDAKEALTDVY